MARERALKEAQSRVTDLEKNVADLQKLLELKNQQLAELEKKAGGKPAPAAPARRRRPRRPRRRPKPPKPAPARPAPAAKAPEAPKPAAEPAKPAAPAAPPAPVVAKAPEAPKPAAPARPRQPAPAKPAAKAAPAPEPSLLDEFLDNPIALGGLGGVVLLLAGYGAWAWSRKKRPKQGFKTAS